MSGMEELARLINSEAGNELVILRNQDGRPDDSEERDRQRNGERLWRYERDTNLLLHTGL